MRIIHRYLGFFLAGIMAVYATSGMILIFRNTNFLKKDFTEKQSLATALSNEALGGALRIRDLKIDRVENDVVFFQNGSYNRVTGEAIVTNKRLPYFLDKMTKLHKANTNSPLFFLNIFFGCSLLFFVLSSFWMFRPKSSIFRRGMYFTLIGIVFTLILIFY